MRLQGGVEGYRVEAARWGRGCEGYSQTRVEAVVKTGLGWCELAWRQGGGGEGGGGGGLEHRIGAEVEPRLWLRAGVGICN